ncbi:cobyric acid synthase [Bifidobacterium eulemuris]|nr:cobyric acid synthase [Bifidobacterium eulemuris]
MNTQPCIPSARQRYYTPPRQLALCERQPARGAERAIGPPKSSYGGVALDGDSGILVPVADTVTALDNVVTLSAAHAGIGLSTMAAMLAWTLQERDLDCALVDADLAVGGLDVLLGIEGEPGTRFNQIDAPLGRLESDALNHELPRWEGVRVLACNPWEAKQPDWWEAQAAIRALADVNHLVIVDVGRGDLLASVPELAMAAQVMAVELSVLGLARAKVHLARLAAQESPRPELVGITPRGLPKSGKAVGLDEAEDYLSRPFVGGITHTPKLCGEMLDGLGIRRIPRNARGTLNRLADRIEDLLAFGQDIGQNIGQDTGGTALQRRNSFRSDADDYGARRRNMREQRPVRMTNGGNEVMAR